MYLKDTVICYGFTSKVIDWSSSNTGISFSEPDD